WLSTLDSQLLSNSRTANLTATPPASANPLDRQSSCNAPERRPYEPLQGRQFRWLNHHKIQLLGAIIMLNRHRKLRMEQMEARQMTAGRATASVVNGSLFLTEAAGQTNLDNAVNISQISANHIRVTGIATTTDGTVSKVNGATFQDFFVTGGLDIK